MTLEGIEDHGDAPDAGPPEFARGSRLHAWLIALGPLLLAIDIVLSLWVSYLHVTHSVNVSLDAELVPGARFAVRTRMLDAHRAGVEGATANLTFVGAGGRRTELGTLGAVGTRGVSQGVFGLPVDAAPGPAALELVVRGDVPGRGPTEQREQVPVQIVTHRTPRTPTHTIVESSLQWGDDTDPQPEHLRIDLEAYGRYLAGFDNQFFVRVTNPEGRPRPGRVVVRLVQGEVGDAVGPGVFGERPAPVLLDAELDAHGLGAFEGTVGTDVLRFEIEVRDRPGPVAPADPPGAEAVGGPDSAGVASSDPAPATVATRRVRLVSRVGGVRLHVDRLGARPGDAIAVSASALGRGRPVFVDVHGPDGAWIDTLDPPLIPSAPGREYELPLGVGVGFVHFEGYTATNAPANAAAVARVAVSHDGERSRAALAFLIEAQRRRLELPRVTEGFDAKRERAYLDHLATLEPASIDTESWRRLRGWLIGSLPSETWGAPLALSTRGREDAALAERKRRWTIGLRWFLWGGGAVFVLVAAWSIREQQRRMNAAAAEALAGLEDSTVSLGERRGEMLTRAIVVIGLVVTMLVLIALMLERLVWEF